MVRPCIPLQGGEGGKMSYEVLAHRMKCPDCKKQWEVRPPYPPKEGPNLYECTKCKRMGDLTELVWERPNGKEVGSNEREKACGVVMRRHHWSSAHLLSKEVCRILSVEIEKELDRNNLTT